MMQSQTALTPDMLLDGGVGEPERTWLRAGALTCAYEAGMLRYIRWGSVELLRGIYAAVRDHNWNTIPGDLRDVQIEGRDDGFTLTFTSVHEQGEVRYRWQGTITGESNRVTFHFSGEALTSFRRNRIGFCVLHPMEVAGLPVTVEHVDGTREEGHFPDLIAPHQPFLNIRAVTHSPSPSPAGGGSGWGQVTCRVQMDGDTFEMEDQRNWTDASFKTYCTPLDLPFPVQVNAGDRVEQTIIVNVTGGGDAEPYDPTSLPPVVLQLGSPVHLMPSIGTEWRHPLIDEEKAQLDALRLHHLRADVRLSAPDALTRLEQALADSVHVDGALVIALLLSEQYRSELDRLRTWAEAHTPLLKHRPSLQIAWLVLRDREHFIPSEWVSYALQALKGLGAVAAGTDAQFTELNRHRPMSGLVRVVAYSANPQVHTFDNATLMENALGQGETVRSARAFISEDDEVFATPVTLKSRWNVVATSKAEEADNTAQRRDPRLWSLFGAAWTVASFTALTANGISLVTYFEAVGDLGVITRSMPGDDLFSRGYVWSPIAHVLADVGEFAEAHVRLFKTTDVYRVLGFVLNYYSEQRILLTNLTGQPQTAVLTGIVGNYNARWLSQDTVLQAMRNPVEYRKTGEPMRLEDGTQITLPPYAVLTLDRM